MEPIQSLNTLELLDQAIQEAKKWEASLGRKTRGSAAGAFEALKNGKLDIQNPQAYIERLRPRDFEAQGVTLSPALKRSLSGPDGYAFYQMAAPLLLHPGRGSQYNLFESQFAFDVPRGQREAAIYSIFPQAEWKPVLDWSGSLHLGLDGNLEWGAGVEKTEVELAKLSGALTGRVHNVNQMTGFIKIVPFEHSLGRMDISASHTAQTAAWRLDGQRAIRSQGQMKFVLLLKVPVELTSLRLEVAAQAEPDFDWLTARVEHVLERLPQALRDIFRKRRGLPLQVFEKWTIQLPG